jgi:hypothetical protein
MYPNPIALDAPGETTTSFNYQGSTIDASLYKDASAALDVPHTLTIKHQTSKTGQVGQERRTLVRFDRRVENEQGEQGTLSVYQVIVIPEKIATAAQVEGELELMREFLKSDGFIDKIIAGEI